MANKLNFSITRNSAAIITKVLFFVILMDLLWAAILFTIVLIRDTLNVDATFSGLAWLLFIAKVAVTALGVTRLLSEWLNTQYYVINNELYIGNKKSGDLAIQGLNNVGSVKTNKGYLGEKFNFGDITINVTKGGVKKSIVLSDVDNPANVARTIKSISK